MTGTTITGADNADTIAFVAGANSAVFGSAIGTGAQVSFGSSADMATFSGAVSAGSIYGGGGADTLAFLEQLHLARRRSGAGSDSVFFGTGSSLTGTTLTAAVLTPST